MLEVRASGNARSIFDKHPCSAQKLYRSWITRTVYCVEFQLPGTGGKSTSGIINVITSLISLVILSIATEGEKFKSRESLTLEYDFIIAKIEPVANTATILPK